MVLKATDRASWVAESALCVDAQGRPLLENPYEEIAALRVLGREKEGREGGEGGKEEEGRQYVLGMVDAFEDETHVYCVQPFLPGKDLFYKVDRLGGPVCEAKAAQVLGQLCLGLRYLKRRHRMAHRDVSLENIMMDTHGRACLIDLGMAVQLPVLPPSLPSTRPSSCS